MIFWHSDRTLQIHLGSDLKFSTSRLGGRNKIENGSDSGKGPQPNASAGRLEMWQPKSISQDH